MRNSPGTRHYGVISRRARQVGTGLRGCGSLVILVRLLITPI